MVGICLKVPSAIEIVANVPMGVRINKLLCAWWWSFHSGLVRSQYNFSVGKFVTTTLDSCDKL